MGYKAYLTVILTSTLMGTMTACGSAGTAQENEQPYDYSLTARPGSM